MAERTPEVSLRDVMEMFNSADAPTGAGTAKTWAYTPRECECDLDADEHEADCPTLVAPFTVERQ